MRKQNGETFQDNEKQRKKLQREQKKNDKAFQESEQQRKKLHREQKKNNETFQEIEQQRKKLQREQKKTKKLLERSTLINEDAVICAIYFNKLVNRRIFTTRTTRCCGVYRGYDSTFSYFTKSD
ncbi:unnamed protein product [Trichogramma brassicae]|uniref:Uncharacterized protein n=1 Tax=Trichogramma brassicae TaxID=86971 RepID=A0A6H5I7U9_9HYME|nr:unnamed protein product [Trichogramma brassicae]